MSRMKSVTVAVLLILTAATGAGVVGHNDTNGDGRMSITAHSGNSSYSNISESTAGSGAASQEHGTLWTAQFEMRGVTQDTEHAGQLEDVTFHTTYIDRVNQSSGKQYGVSFTGYAQIPTPCHRLRHEVTEQNGTYTLVVTSTAANSTGMCTQVVSTAKYHAEFETDEPLTLHVRHDDMVIDTLQTPQPETPQSPTKPDRQGWLAGLFNWLERLF